MSNSVGGFTLVEVLIALVIMSVGMLGIAGLYVHTMQAGRTSILRHHAVTLAGDIADRIRANPRDRRKSARPARPAVRQCHRGQDRTVQTRNIRRRRWSRY